MDRAEREAVDRLAAHLGVTRIEPNRESLHFFLQRFSGIIYENVTKIIAFAETGDAARALRRPEVLVDDYFRHGAGGTCFSLTYLAHSMLLHFGLEARLVLGDRHYGKDTHCAVICRAEGESWLLDVGYLIFVPILLNPSGPSLVTTAINQVELVPVAPDRFDAFTLFRGDRKHRFTIKGEAVGEERFLRCWEHSFAFDMMAYPVLTRIEGDTQYYLQGTRCDIRTAEEMRKATLEITRIPEVAAHHLGISSELTRHARKLTLLKGR